jgi:hypothetical protein
MSENIDNEEIIDDDNVSQGLTKFLNVYNADHIAVADALVDKLREGYINPIQFHLAMKRMEKLVEVVSKNDDAKDIIISEVRKNLSGNVKTVKMFGASLSVAATYTYYDFRECNDIYLNELYDIQEKVKQLIKDREDELKLLIPNNNDLRIPTATKVIDRMPSLEWTELGQDCVVSAPIKKQKEGVKVSFDKNK